MASKLSLFLAELKRRKVYHVAVVYVLVGLAVAQGADWAFDLLELPNVASQLVAVLLALGFPVAIVLAWAYEVRPEESQSIPIDRRGADSPAQSVSGEMSGGISADPGHSDSPLSADTAERERGGKAHQPGIARFGRAEETRPTIAVLPFDDFSPNPDDAYFAGGIHEEILTQLQKIGGLAVRARTSVLHYRENPKPVPEIARELGVQYILEGSARKAGDQVRLTAQLMDAARDEHLWAESYDRPLSMENLIAVQAEISRQVAVELKAAISPGERDLSADKPTDSLAAYQEYLRGKHFVQRYTKGGFEKGIVHFGRAIELDEDFAEAHVGLGYCYKEMSELSYMDPEEGHRKARAAVTRALELDETSGEAHAILASMRFATETDRSRPEPTFRKAMELSPDTAEVYVLFGSYLMFLGRVDESIEILRRGVELDPLKPMAITWLACAYFYSHRYEESIRTNERLLEQEPNWLWALTYLSHTYSALGDHERAVAYADRLEEIGRSMGDDYLLTYVGGTYAWAGREEKARTVLTNAIELYQKGAIDAVSVAVILAQLGEKEEAFEWLDRAVADRTGVNNYLKIYGGTFLRDLRPDPRFDEILVKVGFTV